MVVGEVDSSAAAVDGATTREESARMGSKPGDLALVVGLVEVSAGLVVGLVVGLAEVVGLVVGLVVVGLVSAVGDELVGLSASAVDGVTALFSVVSGA